MSQLHLSDEILMAFADGELDEPVAAAVEQAMLSDPTITRRVADFLRSRRLTRSAYLKEASTHVPVALRAAVLAQIEAFEATDQRPGANTLPRRELSPHPKHPWFSLKAALAASIAAIAIGTTGYFAGQTNALSERPTGLIAQLENLPIRSALNTVASGQDVVLPLGRMRVISTYRLANGSLCREFRLQGSSGAAAAVACRDGDWTIAFALASPESNTSYTPSNGTDLIATYLQDVGAGEPLVDDAEVNALSGSSR